MVFPKNLPSDIFLQARNDAAWWDDVKMRFLLYF
jgi:hypothetical protein